MALPGTEITTRLTPAAIVTLDNSTARADSRQVAATFGKRHADVLRSIDALVANEPRLRERNFAFTSGPTRMPGGGVREDRYCLMDRDGFALLAMGFTDSRAIK
jgi:anti-repressor protein